MFSWRRKWIIVVGLLIFSANPRNPKLVKICGASVFFVKVPFFVRCFYQQSGMAFKAFKRHSESYSKHLTCYSNEFEVWTVNFIEKPPKQSINMILQHDYDEDKFSTDYYRIDFGLAWKRFILEKGEENDYVWSLPITVSDSPNEILCELSAPFIRNRSYLCSTTESVEKLVRCEEFGSTELFKAIFIYLAHIAALLLWWMAKHLAVTHSMTNNSDD